jgi:hypothetical protein
MTPGGARFLMYFREAFIWLRSWVVLGGMRTEVVGAYLVQLVLDLSEDVSHNGGRRGRTEL